MATLRFPIKFDPSYAHLSRALLISPSDSYVEVDGDGDRVSARMGFAFRATFPRSCVASAALSGESIALTRGVHGWAGRWLVNGAGGGIVVVDLRPAQRARVLGFAVKLRELRVSVENPLALTAALTRGRSTV
jgi:hypothetical protein